ncbi:hypothetical protein ACEPAG_463 [Sanghuangporus baumii]
MPEIGVQQDNSQPDSVGRTKLRFIDIGVNLTDAVFRGVYHGRKKHDDDFDLMLQRAKTAGVKSMIITGGSLSESQEALKVAEKYGLYATVGCHPTRSSEFDKFDSGPEGYLAALDEVISLDLQGLRRIAAIGECGLDYDRLHFASQEVQRKHFKSQLSLAKKHHLPLFLHSRAAHSDLVSILHEEGFGTDGGRTVGGKGGVVHSFTGTSAEVEELIDMGFHVSVNGCSLKIEENLKAASAIPLNRLMLETDAPWCSMTSTHASKRHLDSMPAELRDVYFPPATKPESHVPGRPVKGRNEPCAIGGVCWVMSRVHSVNVEEVASAAWKNTVEVFDLKVEG